MLLPNKRSYDALDFTKSLTGFQVKRPKTIFRTLTVTEVIYTLAAGRKRSIEIAKFLKIVKQYFCHRFFT